MEDQTIEINEQDGQGWKNLNPNAGYQPPQNTPQASFNNLQESITPAAQDHAETTDMDAVQTKLDQFSLRQLDQQDIAAEYMPKNVRKRVKELQKLHDVRISIQEKYQAELKALNAKYDKLYQPLLMQRKDIVKGVKEPEEEGTTEELAQEEEEYRQQLLIESTDKEELLAAIQEIEQEASTIKGIPDFWLTALSNHHLVAPLIQEKDLPALHFLIDVRTEEMTEREGFTMSFEFDENPFFENTTLTKEYNIIRTPEMETMLEFSTGCEINWKSNMNLCEKTIRKTQRAKGKGGQGAVRTKVVVEKCPSFFQFFSPAQTTGLEEGTVPYVEALHQMDSDFQIGYALYESVIPRAVVWFTGEAIEEGADSDYEPDEDMDSEDLSEDDSGDEAQTSEKPPECKNQ